MRIKTGMLVYLLLVISFLNGYSQTKINQSVEKVFFNGKAVDLEKGIDIEAEKLKQKQKVSFILNRDVSRVSKIRCTGAQGPRAIFTTETSNLKIKNRKKQVSFNLSALINDDEVRKWREKPLRTRLVCELLKGKAINQNAYIVTIPINLE